MEATKQDSATIEAPAWMNPELDYVVCYINGQWQVMPF